MQCVLFVSLSTGPCHRQQEVQLFPQFEVWRLYFNTHQPSVSSNEKRIPSGLAPCSPCWDHNREESSSISSSSSTAGERSAQLPGGTAKDAATHLPTTQPPGGAAKDAGKRLAPKPFKAMPSITSVWSTCSGVFLSSLFLVAVFLIFFVFNRIFAWLHTIWFSFLEPYNSAKCTNTSSLHWKNQLERLSLASALSPTPCSTISPPHICMNPPNNIVSNATAPSTHCPSKPVSIRADTPNPAPTQTLTQNLTSCPHALALEPLHVFRIVTADSGNSDNDGRNYNEIRHRILLSKCCAQWIDPPKKHFLQLISIFLNLPFRVHLFYFHLIKYHLGTKGRSRHRGKCLRVQVGEGHAVACPCNLKCLNFGVVTGLKGCPSRERLCPTKPPPSQ